MLDHLSRLRDGRTRRVSSWDTTGRNHDAWRVEAGETKVLADLAGAGVIRHIWFTIGAEDPLYLRQCVLRMYWDGQSHPSVEAPVGFLRGGAREGRLLLLCGVEHFSECRTTSVSLTT